MIAIFAGPTVDAQQITRTLSDAKVLPPARAGDIYQISKTPPQAIGLIDGFFDGAPSVWHKEILWALDQKIPVFGASSMGALRAAELHPFGMVGVGWIFEAYRDGILEDDDEVALRHGPEELDYVALSEPMVNIRVTLDHAVASGVIDSTLASDLTKVAKGTFFPERSWQSLVDKALAQCSDSSALENLQSWLPTGRVDQKRIDAIDMLSAIESHSSNRSRRGKSPFEFQHTVMWDQLIKRHDTPDTPRKILLVLDQLRHDPERYQHFRSRAAANLVSSQDHLPEYDVPRNALERALTHFRMSHRLFTGASLDNWLQANDLDLPALRQNLKEELVLEAAIVASPEAFREKLLDELKLDGCYDAMIAKAEDMEAILDRAGLHDPSPADLGLSPVGLLIWYFEELLQIAVPNDLDHFLQKNDFLDRAEFEQMMARQFILWQDQL